MEHGKYINLIPSAGEKNNNKKQKKTKNKKTKKQTY
jgi:hypothetical protein